MSAIREYRDTEAALKELEGRLAELGSSEQLKTELAFEKELRELMAIYGKSLKDVVLILDPQSGRTAATQRAPATRSARKVKRYTNPHDGTVVDSKGGNNRVLQGWKTTYGSDAVESWATIIG